MAIASFRFAGKRAYPVIIFLATVFASSCKKNDTPDPDDDGGSASSLVPSSTGWQKVGTIPYTSAVIGLDGGHSITPYDITPSGDGVAVVYSENFKFSGTTGATYYKTRVSAAGTTEAATKVEFVKASTVSETIQWMQFVPGTTEPVNTVFTLPNGYWDVYEYFADRTMPAGHSVGSINPVWSARWTGNVLSMGHKTSPNTATSWYYTYPASGNFTMVNNTWTGDSTTWTHTVPAPFNDGSIYDFVVSAKGALAYFSVVRNKAGTPAPGAPNFDMLAREAVPGFTTSSRDLAAIVAAEVQGNDLTVLLATFDGATSSAKIASLSAYRWRKGTTTFQKLYSGVTVPDELQRPLTGPSPTGSLPGPLGPNRVNNIRFLPDGTAYLLFDYSESNSSYKYTAVATMGAGGTRILGKYDNADQSNHYFQYRIAACRYIAGAFYALVAPRNEQEATYESPEFKMELIKLVP